MDKNERKTLFDAYKADAQHSFPDFLSQKYWENILIHTEKECQYPEVLFYLKQIYQCYNHAATNVYLGEINNQSSKVSQGIVIAWIRHFVVKFYKDQMTEESRRGDGSYCYWAVPFWGRYVNKRKHFEWRLKPELAMAMEEVFPDLLFDNEETYQEQVNNLSILNKGDISREVIPKEKPKSVMIGQKKSYPRDKKEASDAMILAAEQCEIDRKHESFIGKSGQIFLEAHHLIPMSSMKFFDKSVDNKANIMCLCPNCHREIHHGENRNILVEQLYDQRKNQLKQAGIKVSLKQLFLYYK